jgi:hypothetical protein
MVARTVSVGVPVAGAVYRPLVETVPAVPVLLTDHVYVPGLLIADPN